MSERNSKLDRRLDEHLAALGAATSKVKLRPGMATRAIAAARESEGDFFSRLLRAARFELPALAAVAAAAVFLAVRAGAPGPVTTQAPTLASETGSEVELFPATENADAWASWAYDSRWDDSLWSEQDG